jgi:hypothetical protein
MMEYKIRSLIKGSKLADFREALGKDFMDKTYIAVPEKKLSEGSCVVKHGDLAMHVNKEDSLCDHEFKDYWGRGTYRLHYYEWKPAEEQIGGLL